MNDHFTDRLAKERRADLTREVERDRRAAPLHEGRWHRPMSRRPRPRRRDIAAGRTSWRIRSGATRACTPTSDSIRTVRDPIGA